jgi:glycosyltransferase involved in cell wall biosynthesis
MKFSIITATYNSAHGIGECLASVASQSHSDMEWIVVDGVSTDNTLEIVQNAAFPVARLLSEPDQGIYDALNKGVRLAAGDILGFVHSDDVLASPGILSEINSLFVEQGVDGVYGDLVYVDREQTDRVVRYWKSRPFDRKLLRRGWMPAHPTLYLRKAVYDKHGVFDDSLRIAADYDFILRVMNDPALTFAYLPSVVVKMRLGGASNRSLANILQKSKEDLQVLRRNQVGGLWALCCKNVSKLPQFLGGRKV